MVYRLNFKIAAFSLLFSTSNCEHFQAKTTEVPNKPSNKRGIEKYIIE